MELSRYNGKVVKNISVDRFEVKIDFTDGSTLTIEEDIYKLKVVGVVSVSVTYNFSDDLIEED